MGKFTTNEKSVTVIIPNHADMVLVGAAGWRIGGSGELLIQDTKEQIVANFPLGCWLGVIGGEA